MSQPDRFDRLLAAYKSLLPLLRDKFGESNCPLTAEAVWKYFKAGAIVPARKFMPGFQIALCGDSRLTTVEGIRRILSAAGHGAHGVVTANPDSVNGQHSANVVNIRGRVYLVDAYSKIAVLTQNIAGHLAYAKKLEFTRNWDIRIVPDDAIGEFKCVR